MPNNEIIKAFECCVRNEYAQECQKCPLETRPQCEEVLFKGILDLINRTKIESKKYRGKCQNQKKELALLNEQITRQKAEIERLKAENKILSRYEGNIRAEAIKECLAQLDADIESCKKYIREYDDREVQKAYCEGLVSAYHAIEEMVGDV